MAASLLSIFSRAAVATMQLTTISLWINWWMTECSIAFLHSYSPLYSIKYRPSTILEREVGSWVLQWLLLGTDLNPIRHRGFSLWRCSQQICSSCVNHVNTDQNVWGMFPTPCCIFVTNNYGRSEAKRKSSLIFYYRSVPNKVAGECVCVSACVWKWDVLECFCSVVAVNSIYCSRFVKFACC